MKISSRGHYGLIAMARFAQSYGQGPLSLSEVAEAGQLPLPYLEQVISQLRRAGLVEGTRGSHGGYQLTRQPGEISVGDVVRALEGPIVPVDCLSEAYVSGACVRDGECSTRTVWERLRDSMNQVLDSTTLADILASPGGAAPEELQAG